MMNKDDLDNILKSRFDSSNWNEVLNQVFGVRNLLKDPRPITLPANEIAEKAVELGSFNTSDDRIVGLYRIDLNDRPRIWQNRVGLRSLLRSVYKNDVDAALVVFVQGDKWRLSFISEVRVLKEDGTIETEFTQPKRFTYLLGTQEKTATPTKRLFSLTGKNNSLEDLRNAFSVEALNKEFYTKVAKLFYKLVGATEGKGKKQVTHERILQLPSTSSDERKKYQEFAVRLIGRIVFCWFLKEKRSDAGIPLIPEGLIESSAVGKNYYHNILERIFFQTLNTPMLERRDDLPEGSEKIPFLNGGLFEAHENDHFSINKNTGVSDHLNTLAIPDNWFTEFFSMLEEYNFTLDENSPVDVEISVDPEMLGRIFENLLAEIDPDSGESARKSTGSFYTPREIVNYMVDESLILYLKGKLQTDTVGFLALDEDQITLFGNEMRIQQKFEVQLSENRWNTGGNPNGNEGAESDPLEEALRKLFSYSDNENPFNETETQILIMAIYDCKILDPACGSGAFPIGILQRLVFLLGKLDPEGFQWSRWLKQKAIEETKEAYEVGDVEQRNIRLKQISDAFEKDSSDYGRKLFLIEKCIYGVDIQPIAADISKLRCFLTLVVDDTIYDDEPNRGVNPLPNLEFKFVTADALLKLPNPPVINSQKGLFNSDTKLAELERIRHEYINSYGATKEAAKFEYEAIRKSIKSENEGNEFKDERSIALSEWDPFGHKAANWFDPEWMFGVKGFDIVIGNPPYIQMQNDGGALAKKYANEGYETFARRGDIYSLFYESGNNLLRTGGTLCYITSNKWMRAGYGESTRNYFANNTNPIQLIDFAGQKIFEAATVDTNILLFYKNKNRQETLACVVKEKVLNNLSVYFKQNASFSSFAKSESWVVLNPIEQRIKAKIEAVGTPLKDWNINIYRGILTGYNEAFIIDGKKKDELIAEDPKSAEIIRPILRGRDIKRYSYDFPDLWLLFIPWHFPLHEDSSIKGASKEAEEAFEAQYHAIYNHLLRYKKELSNRNKSETGIRYEWYALQRWGANYWEDFSKQKIVWGNLNLKASYAIAPEGFFVNAPCPMIVPANKYLLAVLNSKLADYYIRSLGVTRNGGYFEYKPMFIEQLPVPLVSEAQQSIIADFVTETFTSKTEKILNKEIYKLYNLTDEEIEFIESQ